MKVIFMGTPEFALPALEKLIESEHEVICVYTQPPRPAGRGKKLRNSPIHDLAEKNNIEVRTPKTLKDAEVQKAYADLNADISVVSAYGLIIPNEILAACRCINIHPSLLPKWRGAAPIQRPIMAGENKTGVAIINVGEDLDAGDILLMEEVPIPSDATAGQMHDVLSAKSGDLLLNVLDNLESITPTPQGDGTCYAEKISKSEAEINWNKPASEVYNLIRGLSPYPSASIKINGESIKILEAKQLDESGNAGEIIDDSFIIACKSGSIRPTVVQRQGKAKMDVDSFLRGFEIKKGTKL